jgi:hypothetical protein
VETLVKRALSWCEAHVNPFTQLLHYSPHGDVAVPFVENAYYALALLRSHQVDNGQKAKWLLGRLFAFQAVDGAFPPYMHDFPYGSVRDEIRAPLKAMADKYGRIVGPRLNEVLARLGGEVPPAPQIIGADYQASTGAYIGSPEGLVQEGFEPQLTVGELLVNPEAARPNSALTLRTLLYDPPEVELSPEQVAFNSGRWVWGDAERIHTLSLEGFAGKMTCEGNTIRLELGEEAEREVELFLDLHECDIRINGEQATTFQLGDEVGIRSGEVTIALNFELVEGEGMFMGHLARGNRPSQVLKEGTYDTTIFLRTLRRGSSTLALRWRIP